MGDLSGRVKNDDEEPIWVGKRMLVSKSGLNPDPDRIGLQIEPGAAFGSGSHPTTQLCLAALERHLTPGEPLLDLGTGSGILAIAAATLGACPVLGLDIEPASVEIARANVTANHVGEQVRIEEGSIAEAVDGQFGLSQAPVVVVNILANVILTFFDQGLTALVSPGGLLILSGILRAQTPEINVRLRWHALDELAREQSGDWVCVIARRQSLLPPSSAAD